MDSTGEGKRRWQCAISSTEGVLQGSHSLLSTQRMHRDDVVNLKVMKTLAVSKTIRANPV